MAQEELLRRIDERLSVVGLSERKALMKAKVGIDFIRDMRRRGHGPKVEKLARLARVLGVTATYLMEAVEPDPDPTPGTMKLMPVTVRGAVQAGAWNAAAEWPADEWFSVTAPEDRRFPGVERFGLLVRGNSMNQHYPDGTIVLAVRFADLARSPQTGQRVVVLRRDRRTGDFEATLKEYEVDGSGRHILWPRSTDPEFQLPIMLTGQIPLAFGDEPVPAVARASIPDQAGEPDVQIFALVVGSYRPE